MSLQAIKGGVWLPNRPPQLNAALSFSGIQIDSPAEKLAFIVQSPKLGTISKVSFCVQNLASSGHLALRLETVNAATGLPSGTPWGSTGTITQNITTAGWKAFTLSPTAADVPRGEYLAIVIAVHTLSGGDVNIATINPTACAQEYPYTAQYVYPGPNWTKLANCPVCALEYSDGSYEVIQGAWPIKAVANASFNNSGTNQRGLRVKLPFPAQAVGAWVWANLDGDAALKLYQGTDVVNAMASVTLDKDLRYGTTYGRQAYYFDNPVALNQDAEYYLALQATTGTSIILNEVEVNADALLDAMDGGKELYLATRSGAGAFTPTTTKRPMMGLILDQFPGTLGYFDVTTFGAKGNGVTDDTTAIQSAINAAKLAGLGSTVFIPEGVYIVDGLVVDGDHLRLFGDGTLKLKDEAENDAALYLTGDYNYLDGFRVDGHGQSGGQSNRGDGIYVTGSYNYLRNLYVFDTEATSTGGRNLFIGGSHNLVDTVQSVNAGKRAFENAGSYNKFVNCTAVNWGEYGFFHGTTSTPRVDMHGCYFEPGSASTTDVAIRFSSGSGAVSFVSIRDTVIDWPSGVSSNTAAKLASFSGALKRVLLDNCLFRHNGKELTTVEIGAGVKHVTMEHTYLGRNLALNNIDSDTEVFLVDTQVGDATWGGASGQPTLAVTGIKGKQFVARASKFVGYSDSALELNTNLSSDTNFVHFEASDSDFEGYNASASTYDVKVGGTGAANQTRKILWLNNRRKNTGGASQPDSIATSNLRILFTTRDWSKKVMEYHSNPSGLTGIAWQAGDTAMNTNPSPSGAIGWVFAVNGASAWKSFGTIQS